ncbi:hypothetical protein SDC9_20777 [bioreactor metagenome]|uniref:Uncharacterized protein n=1 Tax=bioreactor metagenome TaxID=1076179 RepID=A0A644U7P8_9ZZZZ
MGKTGTDWHGIRYCQRGVKMRILFCNIAYKLKERERYYHSGIAPLSFF